MQPIAIFISSKLGWRKPTVRSEIIQDLFLPKMIMGGRAQASKRKLFLSQLSPKRNSKLDRQYNIDLKNLNLETMYSSILAQNGNQAEIEVIVVRCKNIEI